MNQEFQFPTIRKKSEALIKEINEVLLSSDIEDIRGLASQIPSGEKTGGLTIAFCGQYDAGKSTLIKALTGRNDIPISSDVCTDKVTAYQWNGVELLDTPGIKAGYEDHDAITYEAIDRADLLVFVITPQLFDPTIGKHFRELAFERQKAGEMLLVINKRSISPATLDILRTDIEEVIEPLKLDALKTTLVDAETWIKAPDCDDPAERRELEIYSGFAQLIEALNDFVKEKGFAGRLTTPVYEAKYRAEQGLALMQVDEPGGKEYLEILRRVRGMLVASKTRLHRRIDGQIVRAKDEIAREGTTVASAIYSGLEEKELNEINERALRKCQEFQERLKEDIESSIKEELNRLTEEVQRLSADPFVQGVIDKFGTAPLESVAGQGNDPEAPSKAKAWSKVGKFLQQLGTWLRAPAIGPKGADQIFLTSSGAAGGPMAKWTLEIGKFFGVKFKPWGAINTAKVIGNIGKVVAIAGAVLGIVLQIFDEKQKAEKQKELQKARSSVLHGYATLADEMQTAFKKQVDTFIACYFDEAINRLDSDQFKLVENKNLHTALAQKLASLVEQADQLIKEIHRTCSTASLDWHPPGTGSP